MPTGIETYAGEAPLEATTLFTFAGESTLETTAFGVHAGFSDLEATKLATHAGISGTLEATALATFAAHSSLEFTAFGVFAAHSNLEIIAQSAYAALANIEALKFGAFGGYSTIEDLVFAAFASGANLVYHVELPEVDIGVQEEVIDRRSESLSHPVFRKKFVFSIPANTTGRSLMWRINGLLDQITIDTPVLSAGTVKIQILDEAGVEIFSQAGIAADSLVTILKTDKPIPLAGICQVRVSVTNTQSTLKNFTLYLYGR